MSVRQSPLLLDCIGKNELVETWLGQWPDSPQKLLVKRPTPRGGAELTEANLFLEEMFARTRDFRHRNVLPPKSSHRVDERLHLVRNYLQDASTLTSDLLRKHQSAILFQIFSAVDFIHALDLVHTDLQSANMLVLQRNGTPRILVTDFDFVTPTATAARTESMITGAPGHIAPEVFRERVLLPQSDFYALGVMLHRLVSANGDLGSGVNQASPGKFGIEFLSEVKPAAIDPQFRKLAPLINRLLEPRYQDRPSWLGQLVEEFAADFGWDFSAYKRDLLWWLLVTAASRANRNGKQERLGLSEIVAGKLDAFGLNHEFFRDIRLHWPRGTAELSRLYQSIFRGAQIERHGYSWRVQISDKKIVEVYSRYELSPLLTASLTVDQEAARLVKSAIRLKVERHYFKSYLVFQKLLKSGVMSSLSHGLQAAILGKLGYVCLAIGQSDEGRKYFAEAAQYKQMHPRKAVQLISEIASIFNQGKNPKEAHAQAWVAVRIARGSGDKRLRLTALSRLLWIRFMQYGAGFVSWKTHVLFNYAERAGYDGTSRQLANSLAAAMWSLGELPEAASFLESFLERNEFLPTEQIQVSLYTNLGLILGDQSHFGRAISAYRKAQSASPHDTNWGRQVFAHHGLISSYTASSKFKRALAEAEVLYEKSVRWADRTAKTIYNINTGQILLARGDMTNALRHLKLGAELARVNGFAFQYSSALQYLTRAHRWRGDVDSLRRDLTTLQSLTEHAVDWRLKIHIQLCELWLGAKDEGRLDADAVRGLIKEAAKRGRALEYSEGLFLLAEFGHDHDAFRLRSLNDEVWKICRKRRAPRYAGVYFLVRSLSGKAERDPRYRINQLKLAVDALRNAEARYHAVNVALRLIRCYREMGELPRAQNVLAFVRNFAEPLDNRELMLQIEGETDSIRDIIGPETAHIDLLREIGETLTSLGNYRRTLEMLLRTAVNLVGAERGAIVLTHADVKGLRVEVSHACDEVSEKDILTISHSSISRTLEDDRGIIVHDAQRDVLTRGFRSVVTHNIVSIACVPLKARGKLLGALYLDHRSIPGLFGEGNYKVIEALSQFMAVAIEIARGVKRSEAERAHAVEKLESMGEATGFLAVDAKSKGVLAQIPKVAVFDANVLLRGESGTGKGLLAEAIHNQSRRSEGPFIALNCSHIRGDNSLDELFGVDKNAYTGVGSREGRFERADGGTLFLDEIAEMPPDLQSSLLDVIESKKITRRGGTKQIAVDFRLICATNADLEKLCERGKFRQDLFYRVSTFAIKIPPLRERPDDIVPLVKHLLTVLPGGGPNIPCTRRFMDAVRAHSWPGNVRELRNEIERVLILRESTHLDIDLLKAEIAVGAHSTSTASLEECLLQFEREQIEDALKRTSGNVTAAGRLLKLAPSTLRSKLVKLQIDPIKFRQD